MTYINLHVRADLITLYNEKHRHYHNLDHIYDCLNHLEEYSNAVSLGQHYHDIIEAALWFHDAVYNPHSQKNEENSLALVRGANLGNATLGTVGEICRAIMTTKKHNPSTIIEEVVCDIDLSILGASRTVYSNYTVEIQKEYGFVPFAKFCEARKTFLEKMLQKPKLFHVEYFHDRFEEAARKNILWELELLK